MTLQCIPQINLLEESSVCDRSDMDVTEHVNRLRSYRHVRYMWVPYTNTVVTVVSNPTSDATLTPVDLMANAENQSGKVAVIDFILQFPIMVSSKIFCPHFFSSPPTLLHQL
jgi:hypothetical protein